MKIGLTDLINVLAEIVVNELKGRQENAAVAKLAAGFAEGAVLKFLEGAEMAESLGEGLLRNAIRDAVCRATGTVNVERTHMNVPAEMLERLNLSAETLRRLEDATTDREGPPSGEGAQ